MTKSECFRKASESEAEKQFVFLATRCLRAKVRSIIAKFYIVGSDPAAVKCAPANAFNKPVLDPETFQQLLAAAYTLQTEINRERVKQAESVSASRTLEPTALPPVMFPMPQADGERLASLNHSVVTGAARGSRRKIMRARTSRSDELFWRVARVAAMAAVSALVLVASVGRLSPLPAALEGLQQELPFRRGVVTKVLIIAPQTIKIGPASLASDADAPPETVFARGQKMIKTLSARSSYDSEGEVVAQDTVVRYGKRAAVPRMQVHPRP